ncbi:cell envelope integrity protein TolA [Pseudoduganella umbonata]|uniref:Cell envelope integrity protein TolA n=1 Tax=Pseudoduganella umbonata TaxID=864828 RepID=A0A4P8HX53_9BURK|nr:cell envelope integrity protein TolA [Pseudoduganella umbonata]MBB3224144.1 colicin import membrane protein [Pseudoduganella umbonata]QCP13996.1 cell envelope integrity protein TolA [Pseudoduganella umbonata]
MATSEANRGGPYRVPRHDSGWRAFGLALATHALLFLFLWGGINWQSSEPVAVEAEVWDLTTQQAAPPPPPAEEPEPAPEPQPEPEPAPPPPTPVAPPPPREVTPPKPDPEIALRKEREKKKEEEKRVAAEKAEEKRKQKLEEDRKLAEQKKKEDDKKKREEEERLAEQKEAAEKKKKEDDAKKKQLAEKKAAEKKEADRLAKIRAEEMRRITGAAGGSSGTAEKSTAPRMDSGYVAAITAKIKGNISYAGSQDVPGNPRAVFKISQLPTGEIISVRKIKSSGIPAYDAAVENAISKSSPLPKKKDGTVERDIDATFNLKDLP